MKKMLPLLHLPLVLAVVCACAGGGETYHQPEPEPEPIKPDVAAIRNTSIKIIVTCNLTYSAEDEARARGSVPDQVCARLNELGAADGNKFSIASGEQHNLDFNYTVNNDGNNRFTGSVAMSGWGWGYINTWYSGEFSYSNAPEMIDALTAKAYSFIHTGWIDARK